MMQAIGAGFYGKLANKGDFVGRGLSSSTVQVLDTWLQQGLMYAQQQLDDQWNEHYMVAPIWRFYLPSGVLDSHAWIGAFIPSIDRVGRKFPLLLANRLSRSLNIAAAPIEQTALASFEAHFTYFEDLLLSSLEYDFDFDAFCDQVADLTEIDTSTLAQTKTTDTASPSCIWFSSGSDRIAEQCFSSVGLTDKQQFLHFFTGSPTSENSDNSL